ncbi:MAG: hypothetical protein NTW00_10645 [Hyphomicrobiales bacterium]|nr:hypothetical protein [Hyphomicrobiales bacterium]
MDAGKAIEHEARKGSANDSHAEEAKEAGQEGQNERGSGDGKRLLRQVRGGKERPWPWQATGKVHRLGRHPQVGRQHRHERCPGHERGPDREHRCHILDGKAGRQVGRRHAGHGAGQHGRDRTLHGNTVGLMIAGDSHGTHQGHQGRGADHPEQQPAGRVPFGRAVLIGAAQQGLIGNRPGRQRDANREGKPCLIAQRQRDRRRAGNGCNQSRQVPPAEGHNENGKRRCVGQQKGQWRSCDHHRKQQCGNEACADTGDDEAHGLSCCPATRTCPVR